MFNPYSCLGGLYGNFTIERNKEENFKKTL